MLIFSLTVLAILISGCVDPNETPESITEDDVLTAANLIVVKNIPASFEYLGARPTSVDDIKHDYVDVAGIMGAAEGIYKDADSVEVRITVVELENNTAADDFVNQYKLSIPALAKGDRFAEESFNDHFATRIVYYPTVNGEQVPRYSYLWNSDNFVFIVYGNTGDYALTRTLAEATGQ